MSAEIILLPDKSKDHAMISQIGDFDLSDIRCAVVILNREGRHVFASKFASEFLGFDEQSILGKTIVELLGPDLESPLFEMLQRALDGEIVHHLLRFPSVDPYTRDRYHEICLERCMFQGEVHVLNVVMDITHRVEGRVHLLRRQSELEKDLEGRGAELLRAEERMRVVGGISADGYWERNLVTGKRYCSDSFKKLLKYEDQPIEEDPNFWKNLIFSADYPMWSEAYDSHIEHNSPFTVTLRLLRSDEQPIWVTVRGIAIRDENGVPLRIVGSVTDITALRQAQHKLQNINQTLEAKIVERTVALTEEKERISRIASLVPGVIFSISINKKRNIQFEYISDGFVDIFGASEEKDSFPGTFGDLLGLIHIDHRMEIATQVMRAGHSLKTWQGEFKLSRTDREVWANVTSAPIAHSDGTLWWHGFVQDVTARIMQEREANRLRAEAEERKIQDYQQLAEQQRSMTHRFINLAEEERRGVAYDLHDGLTQHVMSANLYMEIFRARVGELELAPLEFLNKGMECLEQAVKESRRLVNGLRALYLDDMGLAGAIAQVFADESTAAGWASTMYVHNLSDTRFEPEVETAVFRIVQEALVNIRKHASARRVTIEIVKTDDELLPELVVRITDYGAGFEYAPGTYKQGHFGLRSMQERASLLGGTLTVLSKPGTGTRITLHMPLHWSDAPVVAGFEI